MLRPHLICWGPGRAKVIQRSQLLDYFTLQKQVKAVRFRSIEYVLVINKEEGRNFVGSISATNAKNPTDMKHKEVILGAYAKDLRSGVMVNETGSFTFKLADAKNLEVCYTQVSSKPRVASCFEMVKQ
jgi:hypothetical protein